jgi:hypothetical protein
MIEKYFMHRIQQENGSFSKGIEIHDTLDSAILSYHGRLKLAYGANPAITFMDCKITDSNGAIIGKYNETYSNDPGAENTFFQHYIRVDRETITKNIDVCADYNAAKAAQHQQLEYGYGNPQHPGVTMVSCMITDKSGAVLMDETWKRPDNTDEQSNGE